jgi:hypothetical protein
VEIAASYERLKEQGYTGSYASVYRFVRHLEPDTPDVTVRVETRPGEEGQVPHLDAGRDPGGAGRSGGRIHSRLWRHPPW